MLDEVLRKVLVFTSLIIIIVVVALAAAALVKSLFFRQRRSSFEQALTVFFAKRLMTPLFVGASKNRAIDADSC